MSIYRFCNSLCSILAIARKVIWRFFLTVCLTLLVFLLANPAEEVTMVMSMFNCTGVILAGAFIPFCELLFEVFKTKSEDREPKLLPICISYILGIAFSSLIMLINESSISKIGTQNAIAFIAQFAFLYFIIGIIRVVAAIIASFFPDEQPAENTKP